MGGFGTVDWIHRDSKWLFITLSIIFRMLAGVGSSFIGVSVYAMVAIKWPDEVTKKIAILEAANGAGLFIGPVFGGLIFQWTFYCMPFFVFSLILLAILPFIWWNLDTSLDSTETDSLVDSTEKVTTFNLLKHKRIFFAFIAHFFNSVVFTFADPILEPRLKKDMGVTNSALIGLIFGLPVIAYVLTGPFLMAPLTKHWVKRSIIQSGFLVFGVSLLLVGPSAVLHFGENLYLMLLGMFTIGVAAAFTVIPIIPEMLEAVDGKFADKGKVKDVSSGIFNMANGLGQVAGPLSAGALKTKVGFAYTTDIFALILTTFFFVYFIACEGPTSFIKSIR